MTYKGDNIPEGVLVIFPMLHASRRLEIDDFIITSLKKGLRHVIDLRGFENQNKALEGKGSLVTDHRNNRFFVSLSPRSNEDVLREFLRQWNLISTVQYSAVTFSSVDKKKETIYHTDCMMSILGNHAMVCVEAIPNEIERDYVLDALANG